MTLPIHPQNAPLAFGTDPVSGRLSLTLNQVRDLIPIFPDPGKIQSYVVDVLRKVDPSLMSGPHPVLSMGMHARDEDPALDRPDLSVVFRNVGRDSAQKTDPVLSIHVYSDPDSDLESSHTGTFEMTYGSSDPGAEKVTVSGSTYRTPQGPLVVFNPLGRGARLSSPEDQVALADNLRAVSRAFVPKI